MELLNRKWDYFVVGAFPYISVNVREHHYVIQGFKSVYAVGIASDQSDSKEGVFFSLFMYIWIF